MQRAYNGTTKELQRKMNEICSKCEANDKGTTEETQRKHQGNVKET